MTTLTRVVAPQSAKVGQEVQLQDRKVIVTRLYSYYPTDDEMCIYHSHCVTLMSCTVVA